MQLKALLLDLDGTLIDTAPDMVATLNRVLESHGETPADAIEAKKLVSNGARALLEFGLGKKNTNYDINSLIAEFLADYADHISDLSRPYAGMQEMLDYCMAHNIRWGVITNKPLELSRALLQNLGLLNECSILLGGDSLPVKKPDPAPLLHSSMLLSLAPSECLYVGDHERDILAGKAAGMDTGAALWGYIQDNENPHDWNANYILQQPTGLLKLIEDKLNSH